MSFLEFGCSHCLADAIESLDEKLLKPLLQLPVQYRDLFYRDNQMARSSYLNDMHGCTVIVPQIPLASIDYEHLGQVDCGHKLFDVEISHPPFTGEIDPLNFPPVLESLVDLANLHSGEAFPAEQMLRDSGLFNPNEPIFFHTIRQKPIRRGELRTFSYHATLHMKCTAPPSSPLVFQNVLMNVLETSCVQASLHLVENTHYLSVFYSNDLSSVDNFDRIRQLTSIHWMNVHVNAPLQLIDLNTARFSRKFGIPKAKSPFKVEESVITTIATVAWKILTLSEPFEQYVDHIAFLFRNGINFFIGDSIHETSFFLYGYGSINIWNFDSGLVIAFTTRLLSIGYGREELHPGLHHIMDPKLSTAKNALRKLPQDLLEKHRDVANLIKSFPAGPLTLLELSRIAVRRAVGGYNFAQRMGALHDLPPLLREYVVDPMKLSSVVFPPPEKRMKL